jgi:hypothetical protein
MKFIFLCKTLKNGHQDVPGLHDDEHVVDTESEKLLIKYRML